MIEEKNELENKLKETFDILNGNVNIDIFKQWVKVEKRQPEKSGYYIILRNNSNPNFITNCTVGIHFYEKETDKWSSETEFWLEDLKTTEKTCSWKLVDFGIMGCKDYMYVTTCNYEFDADKTKKHKYCPNCGGKLI